MSYDLTNILISEGYENLLQVRADDKTLYDALGNTLDEFRLSGSFTTSEFFEIENGTSQTGNKLHSRSGTLFWGGTNLEAGGGLGNLVEDTTPQLGGDLDLNSNQASDQDIIYVSDSDSSEYNEYEEEIRLTNGSE